MIRVQFTTPTPQVQIITYVHHSFPSLTKLSSLEPLWVCVCVLVFFFFAWLVGWLDGVEWGGEKSASQPSREEYL